MQLAIISVAFATMLKVTDMRERLILSKEEAASKAMVRQPGMASVMGNMDPGTNALACPEWELELYQERVCKSYTCNTCAQEWCRNLCRELKIRFGACTKNPCEPAPVEGSPPEEPKPE